MLVDFEWSCSFVRLFLTFSSIMTSSFLATLNLATHSRRNCFRRLAFIYASGAIVLKLFELYGIRRYIASPNKINQVVAL